MPRPRNAITPTEIQEQMTAYHNRVQSWRRVAAIIGKTASYAQQVANGSLNGSEDVINRWIAFTATDEFTECERPISDVVQIPVYEGETLSIEVTRSLGDGDHAIIEKS